MKQNFNTNCWICVALLYTKSEKCDKITIIYTNIIRKVNGIIKKLKFAQKAINV